MMKLVMFLPMVISHSLGQADEILRRLLTVIILIPIPMTKMELEHQRQ